MGCRGCMMVICVVMVKQEINAFEILGGARHPPELGINGQPPGYLLYLDNPFIIHTSISRPLSPEYSKLFRFHPSQDYSRL
jgi:hypothetical protein